MAGTEIHESLTAISATNIHRELVVRLWSFGFRSVRVEHIYRRHQIVFRADHQCGQSFFYCCTTQMLFQASSLALAVELVLYELLRVSQDHPDFMAWQNQQLERFFSTPVSDNQWLIDEPGQDQAPLEHNRVDDVTWLHRWLHRGRPEEALADKAVADALAVDPLEELE